MPYFIDALNKYTVFSGRSSRKEYWYFVVGCAVFGLLAILLDKLLASSSMALPTLSGLGYGPLSVIFYFSMIIPSLSVGARRLHNTDKSGWLQLITFIPLLGGICLIVLFALPGTSGPNRYGPVPTDD